MRARFLLAAVACGAIAIACGGQVVFQEPDDGGSGGSGTTGPGGSKATTGTKSTTGTQVSTASSGGCSVPSLTPTDCKQACTIVYLCGQTFCGENQQLCPNFSPSITTMDEFLVGCMDVCQNQMALIQVADADNCDVTIQTLQGSITGFTQVCGGF